MEIIADGSDEEAALKALKTLLKMILMNKASLVYVCDSKINLSDSLFLMEI